MGRYIKLASQLETVNFSNVNAGDTVTAVNANFNNIFITESLNISGSITGSLFGTSSFATTASYALNAGGSSINTGSFATTGSNTFNGNQIITGSLTVTQPITGSLFGTASFATTASYALDANINTGSFATTGSNRFNGNQIITGSLTTTTGLIAPINGAMYLRGGDDAEFWDINVTNTVGIYGQQNSDRAGLKLGSSGPTLFGTGSRLGIGTITPAAVLDVASSTNRASMFISNTATDSGNDNIAEFRLLGWDGLTTSIIGQVVGTDSAAGFVTPNTVIVRASRATGILRFDAGGNIERLSITSTTSSFTTPVVAPSFTGSLSGTATTSTNATITNVTTDTTRYLTFVATGAGTRGINITTTKFVVNPGTGSMGINKNTIASGFNLDVGGNTLISGSLVVITGSIIEFQVTNTGVKIGNLLTDNHTVTGSLNISGSTAVVGSLAVGNITPSATVGRIDASNDVVAFSTSDIRFKKNITPIPNALDKLNKIGGYTFDWNPDPELTKLHGFKGHDIGVIAQEIEKVLPELVTTRDNGYKAVKYEKLVALLIESNKELLKRIEVLESKINQ